MSALRDILLLSIAVFAVAKLLPGIRIRGFTTAVLVAVVYSVINFLIGWLLVLIALPAIVLTLGLFMLVVNAFLLWLTDKVVEDFEIQGFAMTVLAALLIAIANSVLRAVF